MITQPSSIPVILGTTASGKTSVGIELAKLLNGEVISVDSRKVYKGLKIGTATPEGTWNKDHLVVQGIPHYLMSNLDPTTIYNAGDFARDAKILIADILKRGKTPILVGGTGFYFKALQQGLPQLPARNEAVRNKLEDRVRKMGVEAVYEELKTQDPQAAQSITKKDKQKIIRALEIIETTGQPFSSWKNKGKIPAPYAFTIMGLQFQKDLLEKRIEKRSKRMLDEGMIEETEALLNEGVPKNCPALISFGYKEAVQVVLGKMPRSEFLDHLIYGTKAYAKRQRTWFRTQTKPVWFNCDESSNKKEISLKMKHFMDQAKN
jgi:tRNA dimethylallyltransferase